MSRLVATVAVCILTAGCLNDQQFAAQIPVSDDVACQSYGAKPGSEAYFRCRVAKNQQRQVVAAVIAAALLGQPPLAEVVH
jgi:hypothetical protein